ncbi:MAG: hypothetical protein ACKO0Z_15630 [Betaproteobacteria bacterium]
MDNGSKSVVLRDLFGGETVVKPLPDARAKQISKLAKKMQAAKSQAERDGTEYSRSRYEILFKEYKKAIEKHERE